MRIRQRTTVRHGFTLMEVLLASAIAGFVLYGVYVAIDTQLRFAAVGRAVVEEATLARSLMARMTADVQPCVGLADPSRYKQKNSSGSGQTGQGAQPGGTQPMSGTSQQPMSGDTTDQMSVSPDVLRAFVGTETSLRVFVSKVPRILQSPTGMMTTQAGPDGQQSAEQLESDQRIVAYWFVEGSGLACHEVSLTAAMRDGLPGISEGADEKKYVIAPEVKSLTFSYYDGINWNNSWDGSELADDNMTPKGPPLAIAVLIELQMPTADGEEPKTRKFRHVISIPTAGGTPQTGTDDSLAPTGQ